MVNPQICRNEAEIRALIGQHLSELVTEKQEVKIIWRGAPIPVACIITGYEQPEPKGKYADALFVYTGKDVVVVTTPREITHFEVLPTRRMTPELAYKQMNEMMAIVSPGNP